MTMMYKTQQLIYGLNLIYKQTLESDIQLKILNFNTFCYLIKQKSIDDLYLNYNINIYNEINFISNYIISEYNIISIYSNYNILTNIKKNYNITTYLKFENNFDFSIDYKFYNIKELTYNTDIKLNKTYTKNIQLYLKLNKTYLNILSNNYNLVKYFTFQNIDQFYKLYKYRLIELSTVYTNIINKEIAVYTYLKLKIAILNNFKFEYLLVKEEIKFNYISYEVQDYIVLYIKSEFSLITYQFNNPNINYLQNYYVLYNNIIDSFKSDYELTLFIIEEKTLNYINIYNIVINELFENVIIQSYKIASKRRIPKFITVNYILKQNTIHNTYNYNIDYVILICKPRVTNFQKE